MQLLTKTLRRKSVMFNDGDHFTERLLMTLSRKTLVLFITLAISASTGGALVRENPIFDAYGNISFAAEKARLKNYAIQLKNAPDSRGFILVYAGEPWDESAGKARARRAYNYLINKQGVEAKRLQWSYGGVCQQGFVNLYLLYPDQADPVPDPICSDKFRKSQKSTKGQMPQQ